MAGTSGLSVPRAMNPDCREVSLEFKHEPGFLAQGGGNPPRNDAAGPKARRR
jgi:hypothetical protein